MSTSTWDLLAELPLAVESYELDGLAEQLSPEFQRRCTLIRLRGEGHEGVGEDVTYSPEDQEALQAAGAILPLAGSWTLASFSAHLGTLDLFPVPASAPAYLQYRRWAYESAALDLALRQAGRALHDVLGRRPQPVNFVASLRLGDPPDFTGLLRRLELNPTLRFKLDPTPTWDDEVVARLVALDAVDTLDLKGQYEGTIVDNPPDPVLYARVAEAFPGAWIEDPRLTPETDPVLAPHRARITWDAPIHSVADIEGLPFPPRTINVKPSRFGSLRALLDTYDHCAAHGIGLYGGGQSELGPGRGHIQYLASLFHPDAPNDIAPSQYNLPQLPSQLPASPLAPTPSPTGFSW